MRKLQLNIKGVMRTDFTGWCIKFESVLHCQLKVEWLRPSCRSFVGQADRECGAPVAGHELLLWRFLWVS
jgi:hypothetical protein